MVNPVVEEMIARTMKELEEAKKALSHSGDPPIRRELQNLNNDSGRALPI